MRYFPAMYGNPWFVVEIVEALADFGIKAWGTRPMT